jgi:hypothetical protein
MLDSLLEQAGKMADTQLTKLRWALGIYGVLSISFGVGHDAEDDRHDPAQHEQRAVSAAERELDCAHDRD